MADDRVEGRVHFDIFNRYFSTLIFTQVEIKENYAIYAARIASLLGAGEMRYILLFVPQHLAFDRQAKISQLPWKCLQTRSIKNGYHMKQQGWNPPSEIQRVMIQRIAPREQTRTTYAIEGVPFTIDLLHDFHKTSKYQYYDHMSLGAALDTYRCVITYSGEGQPFLIQDTMRPEATVDDSFEFCPGCQ